MIVGELIEKLMKMDQSKVVRIALDVEMVCPECGTDGSITHYGCVTRVDLAEYKSGKSFVDVAGSESEE